jgi:hypothetical protein
MPNRFTVNAASINGSPSQPRALNGLATVALLADADIQPFVYSEGAASIAMDVAADARRGKPIEGSSGVVIDVTGEALRGHPSSGQASIQLQSDAKFGLIGIASGTMQITVSLQDVGIYSRPAIMAIGRRSYLDVFSRFNITHWPMVYLGGAGTIGIEARSERLGTVLPGQNDIPAETRLIVPMEYRGMIVPECIREIAA